MSKLNKTTSGLLYHDDFSERTLIWTLSPSDANNIRFGDNGLQMLHCKDYTLFTIVEPQVDEYSCIVDLDHVPFNYDDIGGIIIMSTVTDYAECQTLKLDRPSGNVNQETTEIIPGVTIPTEETVDLEDILKMTDERYVIWSKNENGPAEINQVKVPSSQIKNIIDLMDNRYALWSENNNEPAEVVVDKTVSGWGDSNSSNSGTTTVIKPVIPDDFVDVTYRFIKFVKQKHTYMFLASVDGMKWIQVGNVKFPDSGIIGFFLYGTKDEELIENSHFYVREFALYADNYLTLDGIGQENEFEIYDGEGRTLIRSDDLAYYPLIGRDKRRSLVSTIHMPMPVKNGVLRIFPKDEYEITLSQHDLGEEMYGGDGYTLERDIRMYIDNQEISTNELYDLGTFFRGNYFIKAEIRNLEDYPVNDVKVKVIRYSEYYGGEEEVNIALYDEGQIETELVYAKEIIIDEIALSEGRSIFIKLLDKPQQTLYTAANAYRFKIIIE